MTELDRVSTFNDISREAKDKDIDDECCFSERSYMTVDWKEDKDDKIKEDELSDEAPQTEEEDRREPDDTIEAPEIIGAKPPPLRQPKALPRSTSSQDVLKESLQYFHPPSSLNGARPGGTSLPALEARKPKRGATAPNILGRSTRPVLGSIKTYEYVAAEDTLPPPEPFPLLTPAFLDTKRPGAAAATAAARGAGGAWAVDDDNSASPPALARHSPPSLSPSPDSGSGGGHGHGWGTALGSDCRGGPRAASSSRWSVAPDDGGGLGDPLDDLAACVPPAAHEADDELRGSRTQQQRAVLPRLGGGGAGGVEEDDDDDDGVGVGRQDPFLYRAVATPLPPRGGEAPGPRLLVNTKLAPVMVPRRGRRAPPPLPSAAMAGVPHTRLRSSPTVADGDERPGSGGSSSGGERGGGGDRGGGGAGGGGVRPVRRGFLDRRRGGGGADAGAARLPSELHAPRIPRRS